MGWMFLVSLMGPLGVILFNYNPQDFDVNPGDRIVPAILEQICIPSPIVDAPISETLPVIGARGSDGFSFNRRCDYYFHGCVH
jgi:dUTPase